jgi:ubiquinone/menaquinone biosynthesis C-methylase UbiE
MQHQELPGTDEKTRVEFWNEGWKKRFASDLRTSSSIAANIESGIKIQQAENHISTSEAKRIITEGKTVVDVGCGFLECGILSSYGATVLALDISHAAASEALSEMKALDRIGLAVQSLAERMPVKTDSVDVVYSNGVLHHTPHIAEAVREVHRILKPGGNAIIALYVTWSPQFVLDRILTVVRNRRLRWFNFGEGCWHTPGRVNPWSQTFTKKEIQQLFSAFKIISLRRSGFSFGNCVPFLGQKLDNLPGSRPVSRMFGHWLGSMWCVVLQK